MMVQRNWFGYISPEEAYKHGMTHHARYYFLPIYMAGVNTETPGVMTKFSWLEWCIDFISSMEGLVQASIMHSDPAFHFTVLRRIDISEDM